MKAKILIVDDEEALSRILKLALESEGDFEASVVTDPREAIGEMEAFKPDLIVLDIVMPHKNGIEVAKDIRKKPDFVKVPIIFLSATAVKRESGAWLNTDEGMYKKLDSRILEQSTLLEKPVTTEGLVEAINAHLGSAEA